MRLVIFGDDVDVGGLKKALLQGGRSRSRRGRPGPAKPEAVVLDQEVVADIEQAGLVGEGGELELADRLGLGLAGDLRQHLGRWH